MKQETEEDDDFESPNHNANSNNNHADASLNMAFLNMLSNLSNWQSVAAAAGLNSLPFGFPMPPNPVNMNMFNFGNAPSNEIESSNTSPTSDSHGSLSGQVQTCGTAFRRRRSHGPVAQADGDVDSRKRSYSDDGLTDPVKKAKLVGGMRREEPVPEGYVRFRFNEDCGYSYCGYREHQTHWHCTVINFCCFPSSAINNDSVTTAQVVRLLVLRQNAIRATLSAPRTPRYADGRRLRAVSQQRQLWPAGVSIRVHERDRQPGQQVIALSRK